MEKLGLYIHIPFCAKKCAYCDFYSIEDASLMNAYTYALIAQIKSFKNACKNYFVDTIYIGGGTPSILPADHIVRILDAVRATFRVQPDAEISMEANPGTLTSEKLSIYREAGVNRLSIGLQSADNAELSCLCRIHTRDEFETSFMLARMEGFDNISVDIMYGLPDQKPEVLAETIRYVTALSPEHISFYGLKIEPETPFGRDPAIEKSLPDEDIQAEMYLSSAEAIEKKGYKQYEISNFAKPGFECRHNICYWKCDEYLGFGPAAYSFFGGRMFSYKKDIQLYIQESANYEVILGENTIPTAEELATQYVMLGFRLRHGVNAIEYGERFGDDFEARYKPKMRPFLIKDYIHKTTTGYRLTRRGMLISNYILSEILEF
ncbi:MAG: radical SAM family heme chaperone HemW [Clostridia bacterium]|nr:radical SAM family heme chaperone HemW [Clostridia bacterium]